MVYLLHIKPPYKHARHYLGSTPDDRLAQRLAEHRNGQGARLTQVVIEAGHELILVRTWEGGREKERELKRWKNSPRLCPICNSKACADARSIKKSDQVLERKKQ